MIVRSLTGDFLVASAAIDRTRRVNGEREISLSFLWSDINKEFLKDIETGWKVNFQNDWYHLFNEKEDRHGNKSFSAVLDFYFYFNGFWHMDDAENKSMTADAAFRPLFQDKDYTLQIIDNFYANEMSYSKQQNTTERFHYFIDRFNAEYLVPIGTKTVQIRNKIGTKRDDVIIHEDDNLTDLSIDVDSASFCTAIKGYYNFVKPADTTNGEEEVPTETYDYISPMAEKYGVIWGEPIYDKRFTNLESIKAACKEKQEATYKVSYSVKTNIIGRPFSEGDEVPFIAPSKGINMYLRVIEIKEKFDEEGDLIEIDYTFGSENIASAFRQMQYDAMQDIKEMMAGKKPLPPSVLPKAFQQAVGIINGDEDSVMEYKKERLIGHHDKNTGNSVEMNVSGLVFNKDGVPTVAMTYLGIVANAITAGTIDTNRVMIQGTKGYFWIDGDEMMVVDYNDPTRYTKISPEGLETSGTSRIKREKDGVMWVEDGMPLMDFDISWPTPPYAGAGVVQTSDPSYYYTTLHDDYRFFNLGFFTHTSQYLKMRLGMYAPTANTSIDIKISEYGNPDGSIWSGSYMPREDTVLDITLDFGQPDMISRKGIYIQFKTSVKNTNVYLREIWAYKTG